MKLNTLFATAVTILAMSACQEKSSSQNLNLTTEATLHWSGEIASDGCGFEIEIEGKRYLPENEDAIPATYKESDSMVVQLTYLPLDEPIDRRCGMLPQPRVMDAVRVISVKDLK